MRMPSADSHPHLGGCHLDQKDSYTWLPDIWTYLIKTCNVKSMLDVGAGVGFNTAWFHERGIYAVAIEGWDEAIAQTRMPMQRVIRHDYCYGPLGKKDILSRLDGAPFPFDLAYSSEFLEHVEEQFVPNFMETFKCCRFVCVTHGVPGQDGHHHVNCQDTSYWIEQFGRHGFTCDAHATEFMRSTSDGSEIWGRPTLTLFKNDAFDA